MKKGYKPKWTDKHTKIVDEYLQRCKDGKEEFFTMNEDGSFTPLSPEENKKHCKVIWEQHKKEFMKNEN